MLGADANSYTVSGTELDPVAASDNYAVESVVNDLNGASTLNSAELPPGINSITWTITDEAGNAATCAIRVEVSITTGIDDIAHTELSIYPNPTTDVLTIEAVQSDIQYFRLTDLTGHILEEQTASGQRTSLDLRDFKNGVYILTVHSGDRWFNKKIEKD
jgi:hypothetical protein